MVKFPHYFSKPTWVCALTLLSLANGFLTGQAQDKEEPEPSFGHSNHGEIFNEGPRQAAVHIPGTGQIEFQVTTTSEEAQRFFNQGIGQLHGFWDFEAERSFRQVAALDPSCAMAYWGMAMANLKNEDRATGFIRKAEKHQSEASARERQYIGVLSRYLPVVAEGRKRPDKKQRLRKMVRDWEALVLDYPDDIEAKAFLMKQIWYNDYQGHKISSHLATDLLAKEIHTRQPNHPAHHYRIHLWDHEKPARALASAAACGPSAPAIAHMWHMPGHTYSRLERYQDAAWQQEASARIDHAHMMRFQIVPDQIHNFAHNNEWLIRNLNFLGRAADAEDLARNMIELPRLAKFKGESECYEDKRGSWSYGRRRLRDTLINFERWDDLLALGETAYLRPISTAADDITEIEWHRFMGAAAFEDHQPEIGRRHLLKLYEAELAAREEAEVEIEAAEKKARDAKKSPEEVRKASDATRQRLAKERKPLENALTELRLYEALAKARQARKAKDGEAAKSATAEARKLIGKASTLGESRKARLQLQAGAKAEAIKTIDAKVDKSPNEVIPRATQSWILWQTGDKDRAEKSFDALREVAADADLDLPAFKRLQPLLAHLEIKGDWRQSKPEPDDLGERPDLDSLGPFRWQPPVAKSWSLPRADGEAISLADYAGKPVLVIFYLGSGCTHCMEQLNAFAPMKEAYAKAGIEIVAVSTDSVDGLRDTYAWSDPEEKVRNPFPFPLVSDEKLETFRAWRAYDDFEEMPLHGTYLIDGEGRIRWQDISYEPFMHATFLLEECQRLLSLEG